MHQLPIAIIIIIIFFFFKVSPLEIKKSNLGTCFPASASFLVLEEKQGASVPAM